MQAAAQELLVLQELVAVLVQLELQLRQPGREQQEQMEQVQLMQQQEILGAQVMLEPQRHL